MLSTSRLKLPFIHSGQAQKEITHNEALLMLDVLLSPVVEEVKITAPPSNARSGELYVISNTPAAESEFAEFANHIAAKLDQGWRFIMPPKWLEVRLDSNGRRYRFDGNKWKLARETTPTAQQIQLMPQEAVEQEQVPQLQNDILISKDSGEYLKVVHLQEDVTLNGAYTDTQIKIPHHSVVLAVNVRVMQEITGANSFSIGTDGASDRYGSGINKAQDSTRVGLTNHPLSYWQDTPIRLTANSGSFTSGVVRVTIQLLKVHGCWNWE